MCGRFIAPTDLRFGNQVAFHPKNPHILAVNSDRLLSDRKKTFRIELLDVENFAKSGGGNGRYHRFGRKWMDATPSFSP